MHDIDRTVAGLAERQHALVTIQQLRAIGLSRSAIDTRLRAGRWRQIETGVFAIAGVPLTFERRAMAAVLAAGAGALVSHRAALRLWGLAAWRSTPVEVSVPRRRRHRGGPTQRHRSGDLHLAGPTTIDGIPVTGLARTLLDLGAVEPELVRSSVREAMRAHGLVWDDLIRALALHGRRGRAGVGPLRAVVADHLDDVVGDSATEDLAFDLLVGSGLVPRPARLVPVTCADGVEVTLDLGWPDRRCYVEIYGVDHLISSDLQHLDHHRINQICLAGNHVLVYTGRMLRRQPDQFVRDVQDLLDTALSASRAS